METSDKNCVCILLGERKIASFYFCFFSKANLAYKEITNW